MRKISHREFAAIVLLWLFTIIGVSNHELLKVKITGLALIIGNKVSTIGIYVPSKIDGRILLAYEPWINLGDKQRIYTEFINIGTETYSAKIEEYIYFLNKTKLSLLVSYYDSSVVLYPARRRGFSTSFRPPVAGLYYIKIKVPYDYRTAQMWGGFFVYAPGIVPTTFPPAPAPPAPPTPPTTLGPARALVECVDNVTIIQGEYQTIDVTIKNIGERVLNDLKFYISVPNVLNVTISPKIVKSLGLNRSTLFLLTIGVPTNVSVGTYPVELEFITDELKEEKSIDVVVIPSNVSQIEYIQGLILNYEYLIDRIESEIYVAWLDGYDVTLANESLNNAKAHLELAKEHFEAQEFDNAKRELKNVIKYLEDAVFYLASAILYVYKPPAFYPLLIILVEVLIAIGIFVLFYLNKRRKRKPKALRATAEIGPGV